MNKDMVTTRGPLLILYGTTFGMSSKIAFSFSTEARHKGFVPKVSNIGDFQFSDLSSIHYPVVFILSTYGQGGPTMDAQQFLDQLNSSDTELQELHYLIFGLGNSSFENFCGMAVKTDEKLQQLKAKQLLKLGKGDANTDSTEKNFNDWKVEAFKVLQQRCSLFETSQDQLLQQSLTFSIKPLLSDATEILPLLNNKGNQNYETQIQSYLNCEEYNIKEIIGLKRVPGETQTYHVSLIAQGNKEIEYQSAGNVQVYPENDDASVLLFSKLSGLDLDMKFDIIMKQSSAKKIIPTPISVRTFLTKFCDLNGPISKSQLYSLADNMFDKKKGLEYQELTSFENDEQFQEKIFNRKVSYLSFIQENQIKMSLELLLDTSQRMAPRQYTISCSKLVNPKQFDLTITILKEGSQYGLFTGYLQQLAKSYNGKTIKLQPIESLFQYPDDNETPIICVATGAGIGPFRAFCQEKQAKNAKNEYILFYGCRKQDEDYIYQQELTEYSNQGIINDLQVAFSREKQEKVYVQHLLLKNKEKVAEIMFDKKGKLYICGSKQMTDDIFSTLATIMNQVKGVAVYLTMSKISRMKSEGQILTEIQK